MSKVPVVKAGGHWFEPSTAHHSTKPFGAKEEAPSGASCRCGLVLVRSSSRTLCRGHEFIVNPVEDWQRHWPGQPIEISAAGAEVAHGNVAPIRVAKLIGRRRRQAAYPHLGAL